jgi:hypothetical protein
MSKIFLPKIRELNRQEIQWLPNGFFVYSLEYKLEILGKATATQIADILGCSNKTIPALLKRMKLGTDYTLEFANGMSNSQKYIRLTRDWVKRLIMEYDEKMMLGRSGSLQSRKPIPFESFLRNYIHNRIGREDCLQGWRALREKSPELFQWWYLVHWWIERLLAEINGVYQSKKSMLDEEWAHPKKKKPKQRLSGRRLDDYIHYFTKQ